MSEVANGKEAETDRSSASVTSISILIPTYNMAGHLSSFWRSLVDGGITEIVDEIVFINDGSTDQTSTVIQELANASEHGKKIRLQNLIGNKGRFLARYEGAKLAHSEWILFLDSRVTVQKGFAGALKKAIERGFGTVGWVDIDTDKNVFSLYWQRSHETIFRKHFRIDQGDRSPLELTTENYDEYLKGTGVFLCRKESFLRACSAIEAIDPKSDDTFLLKELLKFDRLVVDPSLRILWEPRADYKSFLLRLWERGPSFVEYHVFETQKKFFWIVMAALALLAYWIQITLSNPTAGASIAAATVAITGLTTFAFTRKLREVVRMIPLHIFVIIFFGAGIIRGIFENSWKSFSRNRSLILPYIFAMSSFAVLSSLYLHPGVTLMTSGVADTVIGDGTDSVVLPFQYSIIIDQFQNSPSALLYGAVPSAQLNPPDNFALWIPWFEKWSVVGLSHFIPLEHLSTAIAFELIFVSGFLFYIFGRAMGWSHSLSFAAGAAFAFSAYTRARAKVHVALAGAFHLPAIFLALYILRKGGGWKRILPAALLLLLAASTAHYYLLLSIALSPLFLAYYFISEDVRANLKSSSLRLMAALLPALSFVAWCYLKPLPTEYLLPQTAVIPEVQADASGFHPFMTTYASRAIDYLAGDTGISLQDWNPLRKKITESIYEDISLGNGNPHERANGIRWSVLIVFLIASLVIAKGFKSSDLRSTRTDSRYFLFFALFAFLVSLQPFIFGLPVGPSGWIHSLIPQFRVPSRSGVFVQFGVIVVVGLFLHNWAGKNNLRKRLLLLAPLIVILDFPPLSANLPVASVIPSVKSAAYFGNHSCGLGIYFPYVSGSHEMIRYNYLLQAMRETDCKILNAVSRTKNDMEFLERIPLVPQTRELVAKNDPDVRRRLVTFANCVPLSWIHTDFDSPESFTTDLCKDLGWRRTGRYVCQRPGPRAEVALKDPITCLKASF